MTTRPESPLKVAIIQHTAVDSPGVVLHWIETHDLDCQVIRIDQKDDIPNAPDADILMSFGGPQSLHLPDQPDWVHQERSLMQQYVNSGRRVLGICLGAQMLASAMGAETMPNEQPEVGWHMISRVDASQTSHSGGISAGQLAGLPERARVLHWHQNTFALPDGATHLYRSDACANQGFAMDDRAIGFQFHPEVTEKTIRYFLQVSGLVRKQGKHVQSREEIEAGIQEYRDDQAAWFQSFLDGWLLRA